MSAKKPYLKTGCSQEIKDRFVAKAKEIGHTEASLLRFLVDKVLEQNPSESALPEPSDTKDATIKGWVSGRMKEDFKQRAAGQGMGESPYLALLIKAHLSGKPAFTQPEMDVLRQANLELTAIGKNLNQVVRILSASNNKADAIRMEEMKKLAVIVLSHREHVRSLIRANLAAWGVERGTEKY